MTKTQSKSLPKLVLSSSRDIPFSQLVLSQKNVRRVKAGLSIEDLAEDIYRRTLLQSLNVRHVVDADGQETGQFEVPAGGRRFRALELLVKTKRMAKDQPVPCVVREAGVAEEDSLAENVMREGLHPLDQFRAFSALIEAGLSEEDIAARFFVSVSTVRQRLRLASVAPSLLDVYADDGMTLEQLMAFTVTDNHARQEQVWEQVNQGHHAPAYQIRRLLTEDAIAASDRRVRFIGLDAYTEAGGYVMRDLFSSDDDGWLQDPALVEQLVGEKLTSVAQEIGAEGWKWVQTMVDLAYDAVSACQTVYPKSVDPTPDQEAAMDRLADRLQEIEREADADSWTQERLQAFEDAEAELATIEDALRAYAPDDLARAGCIVSVGHDGELAIKHGLVLPEDQVNDKGANASATAAGPFSAALKDDLGYDRLAVAQRYLADDFACAFDAMLFSMARSVLTLGYSDKPLDLTLSTTLPYNWAERSGGQVMEASKDFDLSWLDLPAEEGFRALSALPMEAKQRLFAHCAALSLKGHLGDGEADLFVMIGARLGVEMAAHWRPTAETFWKRVKKGYALEAAAEVLGEAWARVHKDDKKAVLAETLETVFSGQRTAGITAEQAATAARWLPDGMCFAVNEPGETASPTVSVKGKMSEEDDLPEAFRVPAAE